jgi:hypothetical protein
MLVQNVAISKDCFSFCLQGEDSTTSIKLVPIATDPINRTYCRPFIKSVLNLLYWHFICGSCFQNCIKMNSVFFSNYCRNFFFVFSLFKYKYTYHRTKFLFLVNYTRSNFNSLVLYCTRYRELKVAMQNPKTSCRYKYLYGRTTERLFESFVIRLT